MHGSSSGSRDRDARTGRERAVDPHGDYSRAPGEDLGDLKALKQIRERRKSTDVMCCLIFVVFCVGFVFVSYICIMRGDPRRLYHGMDYRGNLCGVSPAVIGMPLMYWPRPEKMKYPICIGHCPDNSNEQVLFPDEDIQAVKSEGGKRVITITQELVKLNTYPSKETAGRFCLPINDGTHAGLFKNFTQAMITQELQSPMAEISDRFHDISNAWAILVMMLPMSVLLGYVYLFWLKHCARILTWALVFGLILGFMGMTYYLIEVIGKDEARAEQLLGKYTDDPVYVVKVAGYASAAATALLLIVICCLFKTIRSIVGCIEATCDAIWAMPFLLPLPVIDIALKIVFVIFWTVLFSWCLTSGEAQAPEAEIDGVDMHGMVRTFSYTFEDKCRIAYFILAVVWGVEMTTAMMNFTVSYCVACWYFTPCLPNSNYAKPSVEIKVFFEGIYMGLRYHTGSLALSALIVAIFRIVHGILELIAKEANATGNPVAASIAHCCMCCVWCFEQVVRFINKNAIIQIVLRSQDFFTSAGSAIKVLAGAAKEVSGLNGITFLFQILGITSISMSTAAVTFFMATNINFYNSKESDYFLEEPMVVVAVGAIIGLIVGGAYMFIFDMVSDTLLFCWLTDTEDGVTEFAPAPLRNLIGASGGKRKSGQKDTAF